MKDWRCKRFWYQGPPLARSLYFYRNHYDFMPHWRPIFRWVQGGLLFGSKRNHFFWRVRYDK